MNRIRTKKLAVNKETLRTLGTRQLEAVGGNSGGYSGCVSCGGNNLRKATTCLIC